jgi:hypothetical protein
MLLQSGKNNKLGSVKKFQSFYMNASSEFLKGFDIRFFKGVSDDLQKMLSSDKVTGSETKKKAI